MAQYSYDRTASRSLSDIAREIRRDWKAVNFAARPYLDAMGGLDSITDSYGMDSAKSIVAYFLVNASSWRGPKAKEIKAELNKMLKSKGASRIAALKSVSEEEFRKALAKAGWPAPRYMHTKRTMDAVYSDRGTEVAHKSQTMTRGKVTNEVFMINPDYLKDSE